MMSHETIVKALERALRHASAQGDTYAGYRDLRGSVDMVITMLQNEIEEGKKDGKG